MSDMATAILDAAEQRIRVGGFNGFSFREIAVDVGVKSSSVHYHFPTKENLAAAVIHRYADAAAALFDEGLAGNINPVEVWTQAFRGTLHSAGRMCPCVLLGAGSQDLPAEVAGEVKRFFKMCLDKLTEAGVEANAAAELLATITGAMVVSAALGDKRTFDSATGEMVRRNTPRRRVTRKSPTTTEQKKPGTRRSPTRSAAS